MEIRERRKFPCGPPIIHPLDCAENSDSQGESPYYPCRRPKDGVRTPSPGGRDRRLVRGRLQQARPPEEPGQKRLAPDRGAAEAPVRPDPESGGGGQGLHVVRTGDAGEGDRGPRRGAVGQGGGGAGEGGERAHRVAEEPLRRRRELPRAESEPER